MRALVLLCVLSACATPRAATVARRIEGARVVGHFVSPTSYEWFVRGELAAANGQWAQAASAFAQASADAEDDALVIARWAHALAQSGNIEQADRVLDRGLERFDAAESLWLEKGDRLAAAGNAALAIAAYERAAAAAPRSFQSVERRVKVFRDAGANDRAHALLTAFAAAHPRASELALRASLELAIEERNATQVVRTLDALSRVTAPATALIARALATITAHPAHVDDAYLRQLASTSVEARVTAIHIALALGQHALAAEWIAITPPDALGGLARAADMALRAGDDARALDYAAMALSQNGVPETLDVAAQAAMNLGRYAAAAEYAARAIAIDDTPTRRARFLTAISALGL